MNQIFIAHRGYSAAFPENTMKAFQAAIDFQSSIVAGIELDVQLTADEEIIVFHDHDLQRMASSALEISKTKYAEIAGVTSQSKMMGYQSAPRFSDVLDLVDHRKNIYCEIKECDYDLDVFVQRLIMILEDYQPCWDIILHSFSHEIMQKIIATTKHLQVKFGFLFGLPEMNKLPGVLDEIGLYLDYLHPHFKCFIEHEDKLFKYGKKFNTWTLNSETDIQKVLNSKHSDMIEGIMSDNISLAQLDY